MQLRIGMKFEAINECGERTVIAVEKPTIRGCQVALVLTPPRLTDRMEGKRVVIGEYVQRRVTDGTWRRV